MGQQISTDGDLQVEWKSAAGDLETEGEREIEGTSAAAEHTEIEEDPQINGTRRWKRIRRSAAAEHNPRTETLPSWPTDSLVTSPPWNLPRQESRGLLLTLGTSAAAEHTESEEKTHWPKNSIFRVPEHIKSGRESSFEPELVAIGPYFPREEKLKRMEDLKLRCNKEILKMLGIAPETGNPRKRRNNELQEDMGIDAELLHHFGDSGREARAYYKEPFDLTHVQFVRMLFLDSCFIIRTIFAFFTQTQSMSFLDVHIKEVRSDLLLLDNQIPLVFIKKVYEWFLNKLDKNLPNFNTVRDFDAVLEPFICLDMPWAKNQDARSSKAAHLLELYWRYSLPPQKNSKPTSSKSNCNIRCCNSNWISELITIRLTGRWMDARVPLLSRLLARRWGRDSNHLETERGLSDSSKIDPSKNKEPMVIANATELQQKTGIEFEKFKVEGHLAVTFSKAFVKGIIRMPRLKIDSRQMTLLTNLIVFENGLKPRMRTISCYMKLMDELINSQKDVELLQNSGVIYNTLRSHEEAATLFNDIGNFCFTNDDENLFSGLYTDVKKYDSPWHRKLASLRHNYFSSPWAFISFVAALILLFLSLAQTFYSVYGYHKPNN